MAIYMKYGSATGAVTEANHTSWVELLDVSWNMSRNIRSAVGVGSNRESTSAAVGELTFTKFVDPASSTLTTYAFVGEAQSCEIDFTRVNQGGEITFRKITLTDAIVSSLTNSGHGKDRPTEVFRLNFTQIAVTDTAETSSGTAGSDSTVTYDLTQAKTT